MDQVKAGLYEHFKGNHYRVLGTAEHTETAEQLVFYYPLSGPQRLFARPLTMFVEQVERQDYQGPRFRWLQE